MIGSSWLSNSCTIHNHQDQGSVWVLDFQGNTSFSFPGMKSIFIQKLHVNLYLCHNIFLYFLGFGGKKSYRFRQTQPRFVLLVKDSNPLVGPWYSLIVWSYFSLFNPLVFEWAGYGGLIFSYGSPTWGCHTGFLVCTLNSETVLPGRW